MLSHLENTVQSIGKGSIGDGTHKIFDNIFKIGENEISFSDKNYKDNVVFGGRTLQIIDPQYLTEDPYSTFNCVGATHVIAEITFYVIT